MRALTLHRGRRAGLVLAMCCWVAPAAGWARKPAAPSLGDLQERLEEVQASVVGAERAALEEVVTTEAELAERVVEAQLRLRDGDYEGAAILCLDVLENHPASEAASQAQFHLATALVSLRMERWAVELYSKVLGDPRAEAFRQRAVARLLDLASPRREPGFARRPGHAAMPELRARVRALGGEPGLPRMRAFVSDDDAAKLQRWAQSFPSEAREAELRYAFARHLYLTGQYEAARAELDLLNPLDVPMSRGGRDAQWRVRAAYLAAAASAALGDLPDALARFEGVTRARPSDLRDQSIVDLAWMGIARIAHDDGDHAAALGAYRAIDRGSPFFTEALYESAWTLMEAGDFAAAAKALDELLALEADGPTATEVRLLRGKVQIRARAYAEAEAAFSELRAEFAALHRRLSGGLDRALDPTAYFAAVVAEEGEHFSIAATLPRGALPIAESLPQVVKGQSLVRDVGWLERELAEAAHLLALMELAAAAPEKARLFNDLSAHAAALHQVDLELLAVREALIARGRPAEAMPALEAERKGLRERVDEPLRATRETERRAREIAGLRRRLGELERMSEAIRAGLVGVERYAQSRAPATVQAEFLTRAEALRQDLRVGRAAAQRLRHRLARAEAEIRFYDPTRKARREAVVAYRAHLETMVRKAPADPDVATLWRRATALQARADEARAKVEHAAELRLVGARRILAEEHDRLAAYLVALDDVGARSRQAVAQVLAAAVHDVVAELRHLVVRSEVGLLDVAWSLKESEAEQVERLETMRDLDLGDLQRSLESGLEALGR